MRRLTFIGYQTNFEVPFETYFITDNNLASRKVWRPQFIGLFILLSIAPQADVGLEKSHSKIL